MRERVSPARERDGTIYCVRQDRVIDIERCYGCEFAFVSNKQVACAYGDLGPVRRLVAAFRALISARAGAS